METMTMNNGGVMVIVDRSQPYTLRALTHAVQTGIDGHLTRRKLGQPTLVGVWPGALFQHRDGTLACPADVLGLRVVEVARVLKGRVNVGVED